MRHFLLTAFVLLTNSLGFAQPKSEVPLSAKTLHQWIARNIQYPDELQEKKAQSSIVLLRLRKSKMVADTLEVFSHAEPDLIAEAKRLCREFNNAGFTVDVPDKTVIPLVFIDKEKNRPFDPTALNSWSNIANKAAQEDLMTTLKPIIVTINQSRN